MERGQIGKGSQDEPEGVPTLRGQRSRRKPGDRGQESPGQRGPGRARWPTMSPERTEKQLAFC